MTKPACSATTKKGTPCSRSPVQGTDRCIAHSPEEVKASKGFGGSRAGKLGGRPKTPRVVDILKERFEAEVDEWLGVLKEALDAKEAYTVGWGEHAYVEMVPDHRTRLKALEMAFDRVYGKPKQQTEITGANDGPLEIVEVPTGPARAAEVARILVTAGGIVPVATSTSNGNGNGGNGSHLN